MSAEPIVPGSKEWHEKRRKGIGASDAAVVCGLSKWSTPYDLYLEKIGEKEPQEETEVMRRGKMLEVPMEIIYGKNHDCRTGPERHCQHPEIEWMTATPDREVGNNLDLEIKTANEHTKHLWGVGRDEIPEYYQIQCQHSLAVTGKEWMDVIVCFAPESTFAALVQSLDSGMGNGFVAAFIEKNLEVREYCIQRNDELIAMIIEAERDFWENHVLKRVEPVNFAVYAPKDKQCREATEEETALALRLAELKREAKENAAKIDECETKLKNAIGEGYGIDFGDIGRITWGKNKDSIFDHLDADLMADTLVDVHKVPLEAIQAARSAATEIVCKPGSRAFRANLNID